jgi:hypothetical protein
MIYQVDVRIANIHNALTNTVNVIVMMEYPRTKENWTWGIINIPLLYGHNNRNGVNPKTIIRKVEHNAKCYSKPFPALDKRYRYLWFESDNKNQHESIIKFLSELQLGVYWHESMKGYHYITVRPIDKIVYDSYMEQMKAQFENPTFSYSLRIVPNKWRYEEERWYNGHVIHNGDSKANVALLTYVAMAMNQPYIFNYSRTIPMTVQLLSNVFCISRYQFKKHLLV